MKLVNFGMTWSKEIWVPSGNHGKQAPSMMGQIEERHGIPLLALLAIEGNSMHQIVYMRGVRDMVDQEI